VLVERFASGAAEIERQLAFTRKLEAFFGPMIAGKNPPLDGAQIATKAYVDEALARIAKVLRSEMANNHAGIGGGVPGSIS
jgi:hypothetical protein